MHELCGPRSLFNQTRNHIIFCMQALGHLWYGTWRNFTAECRPSSLQRSPRMSSGGCRRTGGTSSSMPSKWPLLLFKCERGAYIDTTLQVRASAGGRCPHQQLGCQARVGCASKATGQAADKRVGLACPHVHVVGARWACLWGGYPLQRWHQPHFRVAGRNHKVSDCMRGCRLSLLTFFVCRVWDMQSGECKNTFKGHTKKVTSVAVSADGRTIVSGSEDKTVR